jgi:hypothetical protein
MRLRTRASRLIAHKAQEIRRAVSVSGKRLGAGHRLHLDRPDDILPGRLDVGRTPSSAPDPLVRLFRFPKKADEGVGRGSGDPPH